MASTQEVLLPDNEQQEGLVLAGMLSPDALPHTTAKHAREELHHHEGECVRPVGQQCQSTRKPPMW